MFPPIFTTAAQDAAVQSALGVSPTRFYPFGEAPQGTEETYAVWQTITGLPENYLNQTPDLDRYAVQVDVYAATVDEARAAAQALRDAFEQSAHITAWRGEEREPETRSYRIGFDVEWFVSR